MKVGAEGLRHGEDPYPAPLMYVLENFRPQGYFNYNLPVIVVKFPYGCAILKCPGLSPVA